MRTIHMSSVNRTNKLRLSCDTRWQPAQDPVDPRFVRQQNDTLLGHSEQTFGLHSKVSAHDLDQSKTTMQQWRKRWGFDPSTFTTER
jgi:hypothetical protein